MLQQALLFTIAFIALASAGKDGYCLQGASFTTELSGVYRIGNTKVPGREGQPEFCLGFPINGVHHTFSCDYKIGNLKVGDVRGYYTKIDETRSTFQVFGTVFGGPVNPRYPTRYNIAKAKTYLLDYTFQFTKMDPPRNVEGTAIYGDNNQGSGTLTAPDGTVINIDPRSGTKIISHAIGYGHHKTDPNQMQLWGWIDLSGEGGNYETPGFRDFLFDLHECVEYCAPGDQWFPQVTGRHLLGFRSYLDVDADASTAVAKGRFSCWKDWELAGLEKEVKREIVDTSPAPGFLRFTRPRCDVELTSAVGASSLSIVGSSFFNKFYRQWKSRKTLPSGAGWTLRSTIGSCYPEDQEGKCAPSRVDPLKSIFDTGIEADLNDGRLTLFVDTPWEDYNDDHNYVKGTTVTFLPSPNSPTQRDCDYALAYDRDSEELVEVVENEKWTWDVVLEEGDLYCREQYTGIFNVAEIEECAFKVYCTDGENGPQVTPDNPTCDPELCDADNCYKIYEFEFSVDRTYNVEAHTLDIKSERLAGDEHRIILVIPWIQKAEVTFDIAGPIDVQWAAVIPLLKYNLDELRTPSGDIVGSAGTWSFEVKTGLRMPFMLVEGEAGGLLERQNPGVPLGVDYEISDHPDGCVYTDGADVQDQVCTQTISVTFDNCADLIDRYTYKFSELYYTCKEVVDDMGVASQLYWPEFCLQDPPTKAADLIVDIQGTQSCDDIREEVVVGTPTLETYEQDWESPIKTYLFGDDLVNLRFAVEPPADYDKKPEDPEYCYGFPSMDGIELVKLEAGQKFKDANDDVTYEPFNGACTKYEGPEAQCNQPCVYCCTIDPAEITNLDINPNDAVTWWSVTGQFKLLWSGFEPSTSKRTISNPTSQQSKEEATMKFLLNGSNNTSGFEAVKPLFFLAALLLLALLF